MTAEFAQARRAAQMLALWQRKSAAVARACEGSGAALVLHAREAAATRRDERSARQTKLAADIARGQTVRLRATSDGARLLPEALADCVALGHTPIV